MIYEYALCNDFNIAIRPETSWSQDYRYSTAKLEIRPYPRPQNYCLPPLTEDSEGDEDAGTNCEVDQDSDTDRDFCMSRPSVHKDTKLPSPLALAFTCRQIYNETLPIFYAKNGISIENDLKLHVQYPNLQTIILTRWLRSIPGSQTGLFRQITIFVYCAWEPPVKVTPPDILAQDIYNRYIEITSCFDTSRTHLTLDLGDLWEPIPSCGLTGSVFWMPAKNVFAMTPWTGLRGQVEAHVSKTENRSRGVIARFIRDGRSDLVEDCKGWARNSREVLRALVDLVERDGRKEL